MKWHHDFEDIKALPAPTFDALPEFLVKLGHRPVDTTFENRWFWPSGVYQRCQPLTSVNTKNLYPRKLLGKSGKKRASKLALAPATPPQRWRKPSVLSSAESRTISLRCPQCLQTSSLRLAYASLLRDPSCDFFFWVFGGSLHFSAPDSRMAQFIKKPVETSYFRSSVHISIPRNDEQLAIYESTSPLYDFYNTSKRVNWHKADWFNKKTNQNRGIQTCFFWCLANLDVFLRNNCCYNYYKLHSERFNMAAS